MTLIKHCGTAAWLAVAGAGTWAMIRYENAPGPDGRPPTAWPAASRIERATDQPTLVMVAHPHCPCTRASVGELAILLARCAGLARTYVLFSKPAGTATDWEKTDLWRSAVSIPGVLVVSDEDSIEAKRFGAETSGQTLLFDAGGKLVFSGGITGSRGHSGDNAGRDALVSWLRAAGKSARNSSPVFGCMLCDRVQEVNRN